MISKNIWLIGLNNLKSTRGVFNFNSNMSPVSDLGNKDYLMSFQNVATLIQLKNSDRGQSVCLPNLIS